MSGDGHFRITLSMKKEPDGGPVYCKQESLGRFRQCKTVKLCSDTTYRLDISFKPPQLLQSLSIDGKEVEAVERARDGTACAYSVYHNTNNAQPSARGQREELPISLKVLGSANLSTYLQIKYYKFGDQKHCACDSKLLCVELDCSSIEGQPSTVDKETYRKLGGEF